MHIIMNKCMTDVSNTYVIDLVLVQLDCIVEQFPVLMMNRTQSLGWLRLLLTQGCCMTSLPVLPSLPVVKQVQHRQASTDNQLHSCRCSQAGILQQLQSSNAVQQS